MPSIKECLVVGFIALILRFRRCQKFSIGFMSGELPGQLSYLVSTFVQSLAVQSLYCFAHSNLLFIMAGVSLAFFTGSLAVNPALHNSRLTVLSETSTPYCDTWRQRSRLVALRLDLQSLIRVRLVQVKNFDLMRYAAYFWFFLQKNPDQDLILF